MSFSDDMLFRKVAMQAISGDTQLDRAVELVKTAEAMDWEIDYLLKVAAEEGIDEEMVKEALISFLARRGGSLMLRGAKGFLAGGAGREAGKKAFQRGASKMFGVGRGTKAVAAAQARRGTAQVARRQAHRASLTAAGSPAQAGMTTRAAGAAAPAATVVRPAAAAEKLRTGAALPPELRGLGVKPTPRSQAPTPGSTPWAAGSAAPAAKPAVGPMRAPAAGPRVQEQVTRPVGPRLSRLKEMRKKPGGKGPGGKGPGAAAEKKWKPGAGAAFMGGLIGAQALGAGAEPSGYLKIGEVESVLRECEFMETLGYGPSPMEKVAEDAEVMDELVKIAEENDWYFDDLVDLSLRFGYSEDLIKEAFVRQYLGMAGRVLGRGYKAVTKVVKPKPKIPSGTKIKVTPVNPPPGVKIAPPVTTGPSLQEGLVTKLKATQAATLKGGQKTPEMMKRQKQLDLAKRERLTTEMAVADPKEKQRLIERVLGQAKELKKAVKPGRFTTGLTVGVTAPYILESAFGAAKSVEPGVRYA